MCKMIIQMFCVECIDVQYQTFVDQMFQLQAFSTFSRWSISKFDYNFKQKA